MIDNSSPVTDTKLADELYAALMAHRSAEPIDLRDRRNHLADLLLGHVETIIEALRVCAQSPVSPDNAHYLTAIRQRLETLYEFVPNDPHLRAHLSDEVDWIDVEIERVKSLPAQQPSSPVTELIKRLEQYEIRLLHGDQHDRALSNDIGRAAALLTRAGIAQQPRTPFAFIQMAFAELKEHELRQVVEAISKNLTAVPLSSTNEPCYHCDFGGPNGDPTHAKECPKYVSTVTHTHKPSECRDPDCFCPPNTCVERDSQLSSNSQTGGKK